MPFHPRFPGDSPTIQAFDKQTADMIADQARLQKLWSHAGSTDRGRSPSLGGLIVGFVICVILWKVWLALTPPVTPGYTRGYSPRVNAPYMVNRKSWEAQLRKARRLPQ